MPDTYAELNTLLEDAISSTALFKTAAFHVHSPGSHDWGSRQHANGQTNAREQYEAVGGEGLFLDHLAANFDIVCITDHMKSGYACRLAAAALERDDIVVLPGMEVNCKLTDTGPERLHLLAIFPPDWTPAHIERIFTAHPGFPVEDQRNGSEDFQPTEKTLSQWCKDVQTQGALFLIAHIDDAQRGQRARFRSLREGSLHTFVNEDGDGDIRREVSEEYKAHILSCAPNAIEIMNPEDHGHYVGLTRPDGSIADIPCVVRSDLHCIEDFSDASRHTHVKLATPTYQGVKDALRFSRTRIRFHTDLPDTPSSRLIGLRIRSAASAGLFADATLPLNPNLNCLIGPRGCGKSTVIEALRYVFGLNGLLPEDEQQHGGRSFEDVARSIQRANLKDTRIEAIYQSGDDGRLALSATFDHESDFTTEAFTIDGEAVELSVEGLRQRCPVRIYSWSEIETLGREHERQRDLVDRLVPGLDEYKKRRDQLRTNLATSGTQLLDTATQLSRMMTDNNGQLRRYTELKREFERLNTDELAQRFEQLDLARQQVSVASDALEQLDDLLEQAEGLQAPQDADLHQRPTDVNEALETWWSDEVLPAIDLAALAGDTERAKAVIRESVARRRQTLTRFRDTATERVVEEEAAIRDEIGASTEQSIQVDQREQAKTRFERVNRQRAEYLQLHREFQDMLANRAAMLDQLHEAQLAVTGTRNSYQTALTEKLADFDQLNVTINMQGGQDRRAFIEFMRDNGFLTRDHFGNYRQQSIAERCSRMVTPLGLSNAILANSLDPFLASTTWGGNKLTEEQGQLFLDAYHPFDSDDSADVPTVDSAKLERTLSAQQVTWDDAVTIQLDGRPVDELSPGQRSSAMLPLIALAEKIPLVIDQPEDNLDNRLVGQTLTRILAQLKEHRQIIVATHSPNIVVGGDAEQVVVLESPEVNHAIVQHWGSIDDPDVVESVIGIMEGGKEAFLLRERRYGFDGANT